MYDIEAAYNTLVNGNPVNATMKEIGKLKRIGGNDYDIVFRLVRIIAAMWHTHPFREGNTRTVIVFAVLLAKHFGFEVNHELFKKHSAYVRNALVWGSKGIYSKYEYLERIFFDAILYEDEAAGIRQLLTRTLNTKRLATTR